MTSTQLARHTGLTLRAIQWWCETGVLKCRFDEIGNRSFDEAEARIAGLLAQLRRKGISLQRIRKIPLRTLGGDFLVLLKKRGYRCCKRQDVLEVVAHAPSACLVVSLEDL